MCAVCNNKNNDTRKVIERSRRKWLVINEFCSHKKKQNQPMALNLLNFCRILSVLESKCFRCLFHHFKCKCVSILWFCDLAEQKTNKNNDNDDPHVTFDQINTINSAVNCTQIFISIDKETTESVLSDVESLFRELKKISNSVIRFSLHYNER